MMPLAEHAHDRRAYRASGPDDGPLDDSDARHVENMNAIDADLTRLDDLRREVDEDRNAAAHVRIALHAGVNALSEGLRQLKLREWMVGSVGR